MPMKVIPRTAVVFRDLVASDLPRVAAFGGPFGWRPDELRAALGFRHDGPDTWGVVAESWETGEPVGYVVYTVSRKVLHLDTAAVHPAYRRRSVGGQMVDRVVSVLARNRLAALTATVDERNPGACRWLVACGFRAEGAAGGLWAFRYDPRELSPATRRAGGRS